MTQKELHNNKAKEFIDGVFRKSTTPYDKLLINLKNKIEGWKGEKFSLTLINLFDMNVDEYNRLNYLSALIDYSKILILKQNICLLKLRIKKTQNTYKESSCNFSD